MEQSGVMRNDINSFLFRHRGEKLRIQHKNVTNDTNWELNTSRTYILLTF